MAYIGSMTKPLAIDLFCGLGGWTDGLLAEGYDVIGFDIEEHAYGDQRYPGMLCIQDVRTLHGSQFKDAALIVASPPCQEYSYMAMPWSLAKAKAKAIRDDTTGAKLAALNDLFNQCFRIQKEASFAAGRHTPMVVENVRGATPWVGRARWNFGSFYLWGDVPALMPITLGRTVMKNGVAHRHNGETNFHGSAERATKNAGGSWFNIGSPGQKVTNQNPVHELSGRKVPGFRFDGSGKSFQTASVQEHVKVPSQSGRRTDPGKGARFTSRDCGVEASGIKNGGDWFGSGADQSLQRHFSGTKQAGIGGSHSRARKAASAMIAKIPLPLSRHIGATYKT